MLHNCDKRIADPVGQFCRWSSSFQRRLTWWPEMASLSGRRDGRHMIRRLIASRAMRKRTLARPDAGAANLSSGITGTLIDVGIARARSSSCGESSSATWL
jgi:hypothetical protein